MVAQITVMLLDLLHPGRAVWRAEKPSWLAGVRIPHSNAERLL